MSVPTIDLTQGPDIKWGQFPVLPPGLYIVEVVGANLATVENQRIGLRLQVVTALETTAEEPDAVEGLNLWENLSWKSDKAKSRANWVLDKLGVPEDVRAAFQPTEVYFEENLLGAQGVVRTSIRTWNGQEQARILNWYSLEEAEEL